jgi:predicted DCC family thiol-disulfide oxidoreductase YuxK
LFLPFTAAGLIFVPMESRQHVVLYDSDCPLCTFQMRLITWLDWFRTVVLLPINNPRAAQLAPQLTREQLMEAIHCIARDGTLHRGARCIRFIGLGMPLLAPIALFMYLPGVIWVAEKIYALISRNRLLLSRVFGCREACRYLPARERHGQSTTSVEERSRR